MPSKTRWALNPKKWFGSLAHHAQKRDKNGTNQPTLVTTQTNVQLISTNHGTVRSLNGNQSNKIVPLSSTQNSGSDNRFVSEPSSAQLQHSNFNPRREASSPFFPPSRWVKRPTALVSVPTEPSIRKVSQCSKKLTIDTIPAATSIFSTSETSKLFVSPSLLSTYANSQGSFPFDHMDLNVSNLSNQCLINYTQPLPPRLTEKGSMSSRTRSSSSLEDLDDAQESSSSGIFTDERMELNEGHRTPSKDTLSTIDALSIESIDDSNVSLDQFSSRPIISHHQISSSNNHEKTTIQTTPILLGRSRSVERLLKETPTPVLPVTTRNRQSSAAIAKKIERRMPNNRAMSATGEKSGFVRIAHDTYRMAPVKTDHLYRRNRRRSTVESPNSLDDSLPSANDEEVYAQLPRACSTEYLNRENHHELRAMVDEFLGPNSASINALTKFKLLQRSSKPLSRSKRTQPVIQQQTPIDIDQIADKLLSSVHSSIYTQYQRYCTRET